MKRQLAQKLRNSKEGFSIIEVMIVLAVAAVIMVIVFLAVPALQRNNRNTQRRNDVSNIVGAVNEFATNNGGKLPVTADFATAKGNAKTAYYDLSTASGQGSVTLASGAQNALTNDTASDRVVVVTGAKCGTAGATVAGATRQFVAQFVVETSSGYQPQCQEG